MVYVIVGFKVKEVKSVHYAVTHLITDCLKEVARAFEKGSEFISLRKIP